MMPGETHPAAPGTAADLARCQGCASLQQNLNEYVEALITLKQKIINTDNLLTEYQKKCDEENSTLHHQVEQMLQKISPLQKCQEELGSLKAELEEKKSSLKLYQDTHQEYARVKEECLKSDAQKKKLEAKVKKLEEAAVKQTQDFKQLRNEKKILEKEFKKTQERLDEFSKQKNEKELRHIGTQISSDSYGSIDKRKVKLLLKELWLCVNSAHRLPVEGSRRSPEKLAKENAFCGASGEDGALPLAQSSPPRTSGVQACLTELSMEIEGDFASCESAEEERPSGGKRPEHASHEESCSMVSESHPDDGADADFAGCGHSVDEDLEAAISFFKLPPPLLSPVPSPPLAPSRLGSCPSLLAPETYFGEYTDSSDNDSAPLRNSAESASEEDATESQDYFGLLGKSKGSDDKAVQTRSRFAVNKVTPVKLTQPLATAPREPSATLSLARGGHWAASPEFVSERERDILDAADRQVEVREPGKAVQAKNTLHRPTRHLWMELSSGGRAQDKEVGAQELEVSSAFDQRTLNEFTGSEGKPPASKTKGSPRSGFFKYSLTDGIAAESDHIAGASHFQRSRARAKERDAQRSTLEPPKPEDHDSDDAMEAVGLGGEGSFSSSTSVSVCNNPWSLRNTAMEAIPREPCHTEQLQTRTSGTFLLQSEPHEPSAQKRSQGNGMRAGSSGLRAAGFNDQQSRKIESTGILKGTTKMYSLPQPVFQKETKGGPHESRGPTTELPLRKSDLTTLTTQEGLRESWGPATELPLRKSGLTILTCSQAGSITSGSGPDFIKSTSWHQSDILRRGGHQSPRGISEREQKGSHQPEKAASALEDGGLAAMLELPRENTCHSLAFKATAASLPNQVSVITKQTRHEKTPRTSLGQQRPQGDVLASATESPGNKTDSLPSVAKHAGSRDGLAQSTQEITSVKSCPLEVSTPQRKPDLGSPSGSFLAENLDCSTDSKFSFSSEDSLSQSQDSESEPALQGERQTPPQSPHIMISGAKRLEGEGLPLAEITEPCEDKDQPSTEAPVTSDAPSTPQHVGALRKSHIAGTPVCSSTLGNTDEETQHIHQSSLPTVSCCYTGIREQGGEDTEVEESEAFSCSEGEHEAEVTTQGRQQHVLGDLERCVAEARPFADVSYLTSALQDFNISTFPDLDRLSTSEVVMFLESCQLRDCSSGDSMSECSSKGTLSKELKQNTLLGGKRGKQICEELLGISEEWIESDEYSKNPSQRAPCSLETLSEVLTKLGQELHAHHEDCSSKGDNLFLLSAPSSQATEGVEAAPLKETPNPPTCAAELPLPADPSPTLHAAELPLPADSSPTPHTTELPLPADPSPTPHTAELPLPADPSPITHTAQLPLPADSSPITHTTELPLPADPRPITHTTELPLPADRNIMGCSPSSEGSCQEHILSRPGEESSVTRWANIGEGDLSEPEVPSVLSFDSEAQPRTEQSSSCEAETTFQYRISTVTSEVINVLINKDQNVVVENGNSWTIISRVAFSPGMEQVILCDTLEDDPVSQDQGVLETGSDSVTSEMLPEASHTGPPLPEPPCGRNAPGSQEDVSSSGQSANFDKSRLRSRPVKPSIWVSSRTYGQTLEAETVASDHTYCNWRLDPVGKSKTRSKILNKDQSPKPGKAPGLSRDDARQGEVAQPSGERGSTKTRSQAQPIVANADTSTPTDCSDTLSMIRQEVGPPLPPLLAPLIATPPRTSQPLSPLISSSSPSSPPSPTGHTSPLCEIPGPEPQQASPPGPSPSPSPSTAAAGERIMSSPLQFCAATPKHALPVPGRLPPCAPGPAAMGGPQENSVKILDTMYPELSARARTLSLLKGNLQLSVDGKMLPGRVSALLGFKALTSTSTAFVKTGSGSGADGSPERSGALGTRHGASGKRTLSASILRSAKRLRLDSESPEPENKGTGAGVHGSLPEKVSSAEAAMAEEQSTDHEDSPAPCLPGNPKETVESHDEAIASALKKIGEASFDLLPVIRSHVYVGNISKKPVMRDQEKEVVYEFSTAKKHLAECLLRSILSELKLQKTSVDHSYLHALCRVYVGVCRQLGDLARARLFCYSVLKEDFPESEKLTLFIANTWHDVFLSQSVISKAMQLVARHRAKGEVQNCLRAFLHWEKNAPVDVGIMVSKLLLTIQLCPKTEFQSSEKFGEDLSDSTWEYVFAIDLLCCHQKWVWTHDHVISKELWPVMDKWIKYRKGHANIAYTPDVIVASILRLIGRLGQLGLKEGFPTAVKNISSVIGMFIQHARDEEIPWGIQLAAVYALCDLSPSNPTEISKILEAWRRETSNIIPSAVVSCLEEVGSLSAEGSDP